MEDFRQKLNKIVEHLRSEVTSLRTGRASPALIENLEVDYYGSKTPLKAMAAISAPDPKQLVIKRIISEIEGKEKYRIFSS